MTTSTIIWIVVIAVVALVLIGLIAASMRKRNRADNLAQAAHLRDRADAQAAGLPDARAKVDQADARAETARLEADRAAEHAASVRAEADQQRAIHEDQIRAADRLDPDVDHKARDYSPQVVDPAGPSNLGADNASIAGIGSDTLHDGQQASPDPSTVPTSGSDAATTDTSTIDSEPTDTAPRDRSIVSDQTSLRHRLEGEINETESTDGTGTYGSGGAHRA